MAKIKDDTDFQISEVISSIIRSGSYNFLTNAILAFSAFIFWLTIAGKFNTELYGQVRTIFAIVAIISALFQFGLPTYNQLIFSQNKSSYEELNKIISLKIILMLVYVVTTSIYFFIDSSKYQLFYIVIIVIVFLLDDFIRFLTGIYFGRNEFLYIFKSSLFSRSLLVIFVIILSLYAHNISYFIFGLLFTNFIQVTILVLGKKHHRLEAINPKLNLTNIKGLLLIVFPLSLNSIFNLIYDKIDIPLISYFIDFNNVAQYSVAYSIYSLSGVVFSILLIPAFNHFSSTTLSIFNKRKLFKRSVTLIIMCAVIIATFFIFFGKSLIILVLGIKYNPAAELLPFFSLAILLWGLNSLFGVYLNAQKRFKASMYAVLSGLITNIIIDIFTLPYLGIIGGVIATTITALVVLMIEYFFILKLEKEINENSVPG